MNVGSVLSELVQIKQWKGAIPMFRIDPQSRTPLYQQLYEEVVRLSSLGALADGERLPSVRQLAAALGVNPNTVQKAYQRLELDGVLRSTAGVGSFVVREKALEKSRGAALEALRKAVQNAQEKGLSKEEIRKAVEDSIGGM